MESVRVFAPGTIGNVGPGFDILGLCVSGLGDSFEAIPSKEYKIEIEGRDSNVIPIDPNINTVTIAARKVFELLGEEQPFSLKISRQLPSSGGLGASASSSVAGAMIAAKFLGKEADQQLIIEGALHAETFVAGRHLDNIVPCVFGGLTLVESVDPIRVHSLDIKNEYHIALCTPQLKIRTADARKVLPVNLEQGAWVEEMAKATTLITGFSQGKDDLIRTAMKDCYGERFRKSLIPGFDKVQEEILKLGAISFSISGAGPTCFALFKNQPSSDDILNICDQFFGTGTGIHLGKIDRQGAYFL